MTVVALVFAALAALLHVYIFVLESVLWTTPRARSTFGTTEEDAVVTKGLAFNQGFYNLFLAVLVVVGIVVAAAGGTAVGTTLVVAGTASMLAAALVLFTSDATKRRAATTQGALPLLSLVALGIAGLV
ncbi:MULTISPECIES: DUF1304 domain-containing protein [unclassified Curtobacterium]|uniref:DUF1304 domain-containing protein n=1 Tax=unclassified Curtobacterium TaxID=257496 RepID=UPI0008248641|nr:MULTISPECIES: DUF1304 domain-containing protein [unclassified Curtobacterium]WIA96764.1 DUF1304 domain-containing protein [Curtobacterium sp. MCBA15_004]WIB00066.1 DUF1304 domain-containing protein [Curtobacterium sp. MCBA15_012]